MSVRVWLATKLRRLAQKLSPLLTDSQIRDLRDYYDNHDAFTGAPIVRQRMNIYAGPGQPPGEFMRLLRQHDAQVKYLASNQQKLREGAR